MSKSSAASQSNIEVLYVVGCGRSGSTILDAALAVNPSVVGVGELINLPQAGWLNEELCACGDTGTQCSFWSRIKQQWLTQSGCSVEEYVALQKKYESRKQLLKILLAKKRLQAEPDFQRYRRATEALFVAIQAQSQAGMIVDSSKLVRRAKMLALMPNLNVRFIHLVRDVRGFAWSLNKSHAKDFENGVQHDIKGKPVLRSACVWLLRNVFVSLFVGRKKTKYLMRYEVFVAEPAAALQALAQHFELDATGWTNYFATPQAIPFGHVIAGNRVRMQGAITLRADTAWQSNMPKPKQWLAWGFNGPLMWRYGYRYRPQS